MTELFSAKNLIEKGEVLQNVEGNTIEEIYANVCNKISLPEGITPELLKSELLEREKILSTAVGNGIAIPHPRKPLAKSEEDCRVIVCYLRNPLSMNAPDGKLVTTMFIMISSSTQFHIKALSSIAKILKEDSFQKELSLKHDKASLLRLIDANS